MKARLGADHPDTLTCMDNLASGYIDAGKPALALPLCQEAAAGIEKRRLQHPDADTIFDRLIHCHDLLKQFDQAEAWRRKWPALVKEHAGADSIAYEKVLGPYAYYLVQRQKWAEAEPVMREYLALRK